MLPAATRHLLLLSILTGAFLTASAAETACIIVDAETGEVLHEENADRIAPPASVTKLMTFLIVKDQIRKGRLTLQTPVETTAADSRIGGTQVWLKEGEVFTVEELLMAMMIRSANDAAHALTHAAAGSREAFMTLMNERSRELDLTHTTWRSPHGLPASSRRTVDGDLTTVRDLARLSRILLRETDVLRYTSIRLAYFGEGKRREPVMMNSYNNLLGKVRGVDGLKTGYTRAAGFCLAATAERDGRRLIGVIMGSPSTKDRDLAMTKLLEDTFGRLALAPAPAAPSPAEFDAPIISPAPLPAEARPAAADRPFADNEPPTVRFRMPGRN